MEIPTKIRFDVLLVLSGLTFIIIPLYVPFFNNQLLQLFCVILGSLLFFIGVNFIKFEYDMETELATFDYVQRKFEYMKYFQSENLLLENTKEKNRKQMIQIIN